MLVLQRFQIQTNDILNLLKTQDRPRPFKSIAKQLGATGRGAQNKLQKELDRMVHDGQVTVNRRGDFGLVERMDLVRGRVIGHADGFGFLKPEDGGSDLYLPAKQMRRVLHGDTALASVTGFDRRGRREGQIVEVLSRHNREIVGRFHAQRGMGIVVPAVITNRRRSPSVSDGSLSMRKRTVKSGPLGTSSEPASRTAS